jgi:hypothetical protein
MGASVHDRQSPDCSHQCLFIFVVLIPSNAIDTGCWSVEVDGGNERGELGLIDASRSWNSRVRLGPGDQLVGACLDEGSKLSVEASSHDSTGFSVFRRVRMHVGRRHWTGSELANDKNT